MDRWLLLMCLMCLRGTTEASSHDLVWTILNEDDYIHCSFLSMLNYAKQLDENHFRVNEAHLNETIQYLNDFRIDYEPFYSDSKGEDVQEEIKENHGGRHKRAVIHAIPSIECTLEYCPEPKIYDWMSYDEITAFVTTINVSFPNRVTTVSNGLTAEGRHIWQVAIKRGPCDDDKNFFIQSGSSGNEWIGPAVAVNFIWRLIYECLLAPGYGFYVIPLLNPDGYEYSRNHDREWVKNRAPTSNENCTGVNIDRNYSYKFGESGSSLEPCSEVYNGGTPFSEIESRAFKDGCTECLNLNMLIFLKGSYKNGGESISYPWSYTVDQPEHAEKLHQYAKLFQDAAYLAHGKNYSVKQDSYSPAAHSGTAMDWGTAVQNATLAFTIRLRGNGTYSHHDASMIIESVEESWEGLDAIIMTITENDEDNTHSRK